MVCLVIGIIVSLLAVDSIYCMKHEGVTIYIGKNRPCIGTVTFTYDAKDGYAMVVSFAEAPQGETFAGIGANVLPGYEGLTETVNQFKTKNFGKATEAGKVITFSQVQVEANDTIIVAGEEITAVTGVFEPTLKKFIILKSTLDRKPNQLYSTLQAVQDALKKRGTDNISKVAYIIRQGSILTEYYSVDIERFQDSDFQKTPEQNQEEKTLILDLTKGIAKIDHDDAKQVHWIKINKSIIGGKINPDVYKFIQSIGEYIRKNKNSSIGITCIKQELGTLIEACGKTTPKEIQIWGPLTYQNNLHTSYTWERFQVTEKLNTKMGKIEANIETGGNAGSVTLEASESDT